MGNLWVRKGRTNCDRVKDSISAERSEAAQAGEQGSSQERSCTITPFSHACFRESVRECRMESGAESLNRETKAVKAKRPQKS